MTKGCIRSKLFWLCGIVLGKIALVQASNAGITRTDGVTHKHRVFPAAKVELYQEDSKILGIVKPKHLLVTYFGPESIGRIMTNGIERFRKSLQRVPDFDDDYKENPNGLILQNITSIEIHVQSPSVKLYHGVEEKYDIEINKDDSSVATLRAPTVFGALHALETLAQLLEFGWLSSKDDNGNYDSVFIIQGIPLIIADEPTFPFRGLMIDTSRHYLPMNLILTNLDAMAMNKMNILHWHLTDRESFPYQSKTYPEIANKGAFHPKRIYTTQDIQTVIDEAYLRGIRVIPEVDLPGHTAIIAQSHPEWMSHCPLPSDPVDATNPEIYTFVKNIYQDLNDLFPDQMIHLGGDEVNFNCWAKSPKISQWMKEHNMTNTVQLYEYFETRLLRIVDSFDKDPIVWQEVFNLKLTITNRTIVDVWKGFDQKTIEKATNQSYRVILSGCWYLDHLDKKWENFYECDPTNFTGPVELMLGGHASMWGEHCDPSNFISRVWPRASAAAERLWSGDVTVAKETIKERIHRFRCRMVQQGFAAGPTAPGFCPHEVPYLHDFGRQTHNCMSLQETVALDKTS